MFKDLIVCNLVVCSSYTTARRQRAADDKTARWLFEKSDGDLDFSDEEQTEQIISMQKEFSLRKTSTQVTMTVKVRMMCNVQQVTGDHAVNLMEILRGSLTCNESDGDCESFSYTLRQQCFLLPQIARPKTELEYFQLFFTRKIFNENVSAMITNAAEKIRKAKPLRTFSM